ncbi:hypothetical protein DCC39_15975 [Pueribacillus theae]|uniref:5-methylcytosine-specific restriction endonuclease system specificity protein McrC n=1 Tax=Pueribacillus theae TaxID=2171751 RepID=A0A2U1JSV9_9BACI|nr:hypothetical protein [Pueribacillus theae]PWA07898.1 hypothetical protein DCC39_15975 [Pueribacillus theae]
MSSTFKVPIRNLFCLLSYVNEIPEFVDHLSDIDEDLITYDFLAHRFKQEVQQLLKRGLVRNYVANSEETSYIAGRMMMNESVQLLAERKPVVVCEKDEYSSNILLNQIMKTTLRQLVKNQHIQEKTRRECFILWEQLPTVYEIPLNKESFTRLKFSRHNAYYKQMIHIALLLHELKLLSHKSGNWSLFTVDLDEGEVNRLFEKFLFHFYQREQETYTVHSERLQWNLQGNRSLLPTMLTDVSLTHRYKPEKVIIDAKFYRHLFQRHFDRATFHSHNLYQIFTYVMHQPAFKRVRGILIYPGNQAGELHEIYSWDERMAIEIVSLDLNASWREIYNALLALLREKEQ